MSAAFPCVICKLSPKNSVHNRRAGQYGFHEYVEPPTVPYVPTLEERIEELERRVAELEAERCG